MQPPCACLCWQRVCRDARPVWHRTSPASCPTCGTAGVASFMRDSRGRVFQSNTDKTGGQRALCPESEVSLHARPCCCLPSHPKLVRRHRPLHQCCRPPDLQRHRIAWRYPPSAQRDAPSPLCPARCPDPTQSKSTSVGPTSPTPSASPPAASNGANSYATRYGAAN